jgi:multiple sugar transport system permease protein
MSVDVTMSGRHAAAEPAHVVPPVSRRRTRAADDDRPTGQVPRRSRVLVLVGLVLFAMYSVAPVWWLVVSATKNERDLIQSGGLWFAGEFNLFANLRAMVEYQDGIFLRWGLNSLLYACVGSFVGMLVALAAGYGLSRFSFRGRGLVLGMVIGSFLIPYAMLTVPLYLLFVQVGLVDTVWAVLIPTFISPFSVYLAKVYVDGAIPPELLEAARIDGAGEVRIFFQIVLRMLGTCGATVFLLAFVQSWNGFFLPLTMLQGAENWTLTLGLYNWLVQSHTSAGGSVVDFTALVITGALLSVVPLATFLLAMQRFWRSGVSLGALKS